VVIDLPKDIVGPAVRMPYAYPQDVSMRSYNPTVQGHRGQIKRALQTILAAKKPVMYVGGGAINAGCEAELLALAEQLNLPVTSSLMGLGAFPGTHRQSVGMLGMHGTYE
ncbi:acetolactate synthase large subunit, partial [Dietzia sp. Marseille-Q0999]|nr:acetolactate synthase large subunit [Dietzia massiliensis]